MKRVVSDQTFKTQTPQNAAPHWARPGTAAPRRPRGHNGLFQNQGRHDWNVCIPATAASLACRPRPGQRCSLAGETRKQLWDTSVCRKILIQMRLELKGAENSPEIFTRLPRKRCGSRKAREREDHPCFVMNTMASQQVGDTEKQTHHLTTAPHFYPPALAKDKSRQADREKPALPTLWKQGPRSHLHCDGHQHSPG